MKKLIRPVTALFLCVLFIDCSHKSSESNNASGSTSQSANETSSEGAWRIVNVKDNAGKIVPGKSAIAAVFKGRMSNSSTSDADLTVRMQIHDSTIITVFYEYKIETQAKLPESGYINAIAKLSDGKLDKAKQFFFKDMMVDNDKQLFYLLLSQSSPVKMTVDLTRFNKRENTVYNYEIDPAGLENILKRNAK